MISAASYLAIVVYLFPLLLVWVARSHREREPWAFALDVPLVVAADFALVMMLARLVPLERAALMARLGWLVGFAVWMELRRRRAGEAAEGSWWSRAKHAWPRSVDKPVVAVVLCAVTLAVLISAQMSHHCHNYDRGWHIPLATSLRGQRLPFANVYQPGKALAYHFTGDVLGAMLQTYSRNVIHMTLALGIAHDILYGLSAGCIAILAWSVGLRGIVPTALASIVPLMASPLRVLAPEGHRNGYNFINLLKLGYRPHTPVAMLLMVGVVGPLIVRMCCRSAPKLRDTVVPLLASCALLAVTDEASVGALGLAMGATWVLVPSILAPRRREGVGILLFLLVAVVASNLLFSAALVGESGRLFSWVPGRAPGYYNAPLSLSTDAAVKHTRLDLLPVLLIGAGGLFYLGGRRDRAALSLALFWGVLTWVSYQLLVHVDIGERSVESHRFFTAALFVTPLLGLPWLAGGGHRPHWGAAKTIVTIGMSLMVYGSLDWSLRATKPGGRGCTKASLYSSERELFDVSCRRDTGARFGERPRVTYVDKAITYVYAGCHPTFLSGPPIPRVRSDRIDKASRAIVPTWTMRIGKAESEIPALTDLLHHRLPPGQDLVLVCKSRGRNDRVCRKVRGFGLHCSPLAPGMSHCILPAVRRKDFLDRVTRP